MSFFIYSILALSGTIIAFLSMRSLYIRYPYAILHPVLTTTTILAIILVLLQIPYESYASYTKGIEQLLGACVVALAYPLYKQRDTMMKYKKVICWSVFIGIFTAISSVILLAKLAQVAELELLSLISKSITTPVAITITEVLGGITSLAIVFVMVAGFSGIIIGPFLMKKLHIHHPVSKGLALGSASHALGVAKSTEFGEKSLSMATVSMTISAIIGALIGPLILLIL